MFVTLWAIWHARRKAIHEHVFQSQLSVHCFVENFISDLNQCGEQEQKCRVATTCQSGPRWIAPPQGMIKVNVDAAVGKNSGRGAVAAVARSDNGVFLGASVITFPGQTDAETLEALACREAVALATDIHARSVRVASDCMNMVKKLEGGTTGVYA